MSIKFKNSKLIQCKAFLIKICAGIITEGVYEVIIQINTLIPCSIAIFFIWFLSGLNVEWELKLKFNSNATYDE